jgi:hypothetical protein
MTPSLGICVKGRSDLAGPLCNTFLGRDRKWYVVASGRANHAGTGSWRSVTGNSLFHGTEVEHDGVSVLPDDMVELLTIGVAAISAGRYSEEMVCQHWEYSSVGKIDIAKNFHGMDDPKPSKNQFRRMVAEAKDDLKGGKNSKIVFPTNEKKAGAWVRREVEIPRDKVEKWFADHPHVVQREGKGGLITIRAV